MGSDGDDEEYRLAFGGHTGISGEIYRIKSNDPRFTKFDLGSRDAEHFTDMSWELLGRYINENDHLEIVDLSRCGLTDSNTSLLLRRPWRNVIQLNLAFSNIQRSISSSLIHPTGQIRPQRLSRAMTLFQSPRIRTA